jgi:hypothetical protein
MWPIFGKWTSLPDDGSAYLQKEKDTTYFKPVFLFFRPHFPVNGCRSCCDFLLAELLQHPHPSLPAQIVP